ncbi:hypothetical protein ACFQUU_25215 [Herbaspirillum sp. GCM10030257]|uniref:hypothetical protein n=1 Tax=Herbaspirillum sp. GCM10030257 TaxID=3273393 RepID=UPI003607D70E
MSSEVGLSQLIAHRSSLVAHYFFERRQSKITGLRGLFLESDEQKIELFKSTRFFLAKCCGLPNFAHILPYTATRDASPESLDVHIQNAVTKICGMATRHSTVFTRPATGIASPIWAHALLEIAHLGFNLLRL